MQVRTIIVIGIALMLALAACRCGQCQLPHPSVPDVLTLREDGTLLAVGGQVVSEAAHGRVQIWSLYDRHLVATLDDGGAVTCLAFQPHRRILLAGSDDGVLRFWDFHRKSVVRVVPAGGPVRAVSFQRDGGLAAWIADDRTVRLVDSDTGGIWGHIRAVARPTSIAFARGGESIAVGGEDGSVVEWSLHSRSERRRWAMRGRVSSLAGDGSTLSVGTEAGIVLLDVRTGARIRLLKAGGTPRNLQFGDHGRLLAAALDGGQVQLWEEASGRSLHVLPGTAMAMSPVSDLIGTIVGNVQVWRARTGQRLFML